MVEIMYETEKVKVTYDKWDLGGQYRAFTKENPYGTRVAFQTYSEALNYAKKLERGF